MWDVFVSIMVMITEIWCLNTCMCWQKCWNLNSFMWDVFVLIMAMDHLDLVSEHVLAKMLELEGHRKKLTRNIVWDRI